MNEVEQKSDWELIKDFYRKYGPVKATLMAVSFAIVVYYGIKALGIVVGFLKFISE